jgi:hypothetical protein
VDHTSLNCFPDPSAGRVHNCRVNCRLVTVAAVTLRSPPDGQAPVIAKAPAYNVEIGNLVGCHPDTRVDPVGEISPVASGPTGRDQAPSRRSTQSSPIRLDARLHRPLITPHSVQVRTLVMLYQKGGSV